LWGESQAGRAGYLHLLNLREGEPADTARALLAAWEEWLAARGARFYQLQLDYPSAPEASLVRAAGLQHAGDLLYLASDLAGAAAPPRGLQFEPYSESQEERMEKLVERTYESSLDFPILDGVRALEEVLDGYRHSGDYRPEFWRFVLQEEKDIGCLLLTPHAEAAWELVYMGLVPQARGAGLGTAITAYAQGLVRAFGGRRLFLAVDAANSPAVASYRRAGFEPWREASVFLKILHSVRNSL
jgi:ribosomal protein S18 acetylase RimI-like enzyme